MFRPRWNNSSVLLGVCATLLLIAPVASALEVEVAGPVTATIGDNLVVELVVRGEGQAILVDGLRVDAEGTAVVGEPYPVRILSGERSADGTSFAGGPLRLEWAVPVPPNTEAGDRSLSLTVHARTEAGAVTANWSGTVALDYGDDWSADRISAFIEEKGLAFFLVLVFGFGILMSLSPCIYPMIPITLAVIGAQSQEKGVAHGLAMSVTYVLGMALVYAVLGALSATVLSGITAYMQSPYVVGPIAILLIVLAFSMFGAFELQAPAFLRDRLQGPGGGKGGVVGVFAMGMVAGLVASPCVGPFLAALLVWVGTTGNWVLGFFSLLTFGIGMGLLLIGVGTFPALLGNLPQSGGWMDTIKKGMGLLLLAMAFWFVRPSIFLTAKIYYPLLGTTTVVVAIFIGAFDPVTKGAHWWDRARRGLGIVTLVAGLYLVVGSFLWGGFLVPSPFADEPDVTKVTEYTETGSSGAVVTETAAVPLPGKVVWEKIHTGENVRAFLDGKRAEAKAAGKPMMIDFWATWCVYCKKLDKTVWNQTEVVAEAQRFVTIKIDATVPDDEEMSGIKEEWSVAGLPRIIFIDSRGEFLPGRSTGFQPAADMLATMRSIR